MPESHARTPIPPPPKGPLAAGQDRVARALGVTPGDRRTLVEEMLVPGRAAYWLQLLLALAIATLGLLLGSGAVVIGAMLISPLMRPIIGLGLGLAVGSPLLVIRSLARVVLSICVVVTSSMLITLAVPVHAVTGEIAARTTPTLLDLAVAGCCALAAVYASCRSGSDTASTAAGTAIGIALVPPLCVVGFGIGTAAPSIAGGAALLFTANVCAIVALSTIAFMLLGYGQVDTVALEREQSGAIGGAGVGARALRRLSLFFSSRIGPLVRLAMPLALVAAVFVPLRHALVEVAWEVRVRSETEAALKTLAKRAVESAVRIERHQVSVKVITIGAASEAAELRKELGARIEEVAGVVPDLDVIAVPDAASLARSEASLRDALVGPTRPIPDLPVAAVRRPLASIVASWPGQDVGALAAWQVSIGPEGAARVHVLHVGKPLGDAARHIVESTASTALGERVVVVDDAVTGIEPTTDDEAVPRIARSVAALRSYAGAPLFACVTVRDDAAARAIRAAADDRTSISTGAVHALAWSAEQCPLADGGSDGDASLEGGAARAAPTAASGAEHAEDAGPR